MKRMKYKDIFKEFLKAHEWDFCECNKDIFKEFLKAHEWDFCECIERFLEWCEREGIEINAKVQEEDHSVNEL